MSKEFSESRPSKLSNETFGRMLQQAIKYVHTGKEPYIPWDKASNQKDDFHAAIANGMPTEAVVGKYNSHTADRESNEAVKHVDAIVYGESATRTTPLPDEGNCLGSVWFVMTNSRTIPPERVSTVSARSKFSTEGNIFYEVYGFMIAADSEGHAEVDGALHKMGFPVTIADLKESPDRKVRGSMNEQNGHNFLQTLQDFTEKKELQVGASNRSNQVEERTIE